MPDGLMISGYIWNRLEQIHSSLLYGSVMITRIGKKTPNSKFGSEIPRT
jgi:hypothetical protein